MPWSKNLGYSSGKERKTHNTLALGAIIIWLLNGLYHRQQHNFKALGREACQHLPINYDKYDEDLDHEHKDFIPLMYDVGLYFLCNIVDDQSGTYRILYHKTFSKQALVSAFKLSTIQIREIISAEDHPCQRHNANPDHTSN